VTVQLPTLSFFTVSTTVVVPDRGGAALGGVGSSRRRSSSFGSPLIPGRNRGFAAGMSIGGMSTHAFVHDFEAMDKALLEQAAAQRRSADGPEIVRDTLDPARNRKVGSLAEIRAQQADAEAAEQAEALAYFEKARRMQEQGKKGVARIYYQMALRRASGKLKEQATAALESLRSRKVARGK